VEDASDKLIRSLFEKIDKLKAEIVELKSEIAFLKNRKKSGTVLFYLL